MTQAGPVYLDANIFIATFEGAPGQALSRELGQLFAQAAAGRLMLATSALTLSEILVRPIALRHETLTRRYLQMFRVGLPWLNIYPIDQDILIRAAAIRAERRMKLPDALHVATALEHRVARFLTADMGIGSQDGLDVLRPTPEVLLSLTKGSVA